jgi:hypothetical protein
VRLGGGAKWYDRHIDCPWLLLTLLCNGNCLLECLPGLAKTRAVKSLARHLEAELKRVRIKHEWPAWPVTTGQEAGDSSLPRHRPPTRHPGPGCAPRHGCDTEATPILSRSTGLSRHSTAHS